MKISWGQICVILMLGRIFTLMTYVPLIGSDYYLTTEMVGLLISTVLQALIVIPILYLNKVYSGKSICEIAYSKGNIVGFLVSLIYLLFFIILGINCVSQFSTFITDVFFPQSSIILGAILLLVSGVYAAYKGLEGIGRSATIVFVIFLSLLIFLFFSSWEGMNILNYAPVIGLKAKQIWSAVVNDMYRSNELVAIAVLLPYVNNMRKGTYYAIAGKLIMLEVITFFMITVLGGYANEITFPFFSLGSYSSKNVIERMDAIYLIAWVLTAIINISVIIIMLSDILKNIYKKLKYAEIIGGVAVLGGSVPVFMKNEQYGELCRRLQGIETFLITLLVIPLIFVIVGRKKTNEKIYHINCADADDKSFNRV